MPKEPKAASPTELLKISLDWHLETLAAQIQIFQAFWIWRAGIGALISEARTEKIPTEVALAQIEQMLLGIGEDLQTAEKLIRKNQRAVRQRRRNWFGPTRPSKSPDYAAILRNLKIRGKVH